MTAEPTRTSTNETLSPSPLIRKAAVLGAGTTGARIAPHLTMCVGGGMGAAGIFENLN